MALVSILFPAVTFQLQLVLDRPADADLVKLIGRASSTASTVANSFALEGLSTEHPTNIFRELLGCCRILPEMLSQRKKFQS